MKFIIEVNINKEQMNQDGKLINNYDFKTLKEKIETVDYTKVLNIKRSEN